MSAHDIQQLYAILSSLPPDPNHLPLPPMDEDLLFLPDDVPLPPMDENFVIPADALDDEYRVRTPNEDDCWLNSVTNFGDNMFDIRCAFVVC